MLALMQRHRIYNELQDQAGPSLRGPNSTAPTALSPPRPHRGGEAMSNPMHGPYLITRHPLHEAVEQNLAPVLDTRVHALLLDLAAALCQ
jgi:hypothetical protein